MPSFQPPVLYRGFSLVTYFIYSSVNMSAPISKFIPTPWCPFCCLVLSPVRLFWDLTDCSPPGSSVHGIFQARILEWVAISFSRGLPKPGIKPMSFAQEENICSVHLCLYFCSANRLICTILSFAETWMDLETVIQSKGSQRKINIIY